MINDIEIAIKILEKEIEGLVNIKKYNFNSNLIKALDIIDNTAGRVVVSGVGKSGDVGKKISSTLSSVGIKSFFIHSSEASHGDMGCICNESDVLLAISNSGQTKEIIDICIYAKNNNMPIISILSNEKSFLFNNSDVAIVTKIDSEAIENLPAPTTSTTVTLVIGDIIAGCLAKRKNFNYEDYNKLHPGGNLGFLAGKIKNVMKDKTYIPSVNKNGIIKNAILEMTSKSFGLVAILDNDNNDKVIGIISDGDIRRYIDDDNFLNQSVLDIMNVNPKIVKDSMYVVDVIKYLRDNKILTVLIENDDKNIIGITQLYDLIK